MGYVLDTNVLVSAALGDGPARQLLLALAQRGELRTSRFILEEFLRVFAAAPQLRRAPPLASARLAAFVERHAALVEPAKVAWKGSAGDASVLGTAVAAGAVLVTGDRRVLDGAASVGVRACTIRAALDEVAG